MKRVCVIGNSHIAAIKQGWDAVKDGHPEFELTFFGSPGKNLKELHIENGALVPRSEKIRKHLQSTSHGKSEIVIGNFDAFLVVGLELNILGIVELYRNYRSEEHKNTTKVNQYVSDACFMRAAKGILQNSLALEIAETLRRLTDRRIVIVPQPLPSEETISARPLWKAIVDHGDHLSVARIFARAMSEMTTASEYILQQPEETKSREIFTKNEYGEGAVRLKGNFDIKHPEDDNKHMNQAYGVIVMRNAIPLL